MEASARKVQAERNRNRLPHRGRASRWARRIAGLLATAAFLGVGVAITLMILPDTGNDESAIAAAPTATPAKQKAKKKVVKKKAAKPKGPTKAQLAMRTAAVADCATRASPRSSSSDYDPKATLRVLVGRPVGDAAGGNRAFFFVKDAFLGNDAQLAEREADGRQDRQERPSRSPTASTRPATPSAPRAAASACASGSTAGQLMPLDTIPLDSVRFQRRKS